MTDIIARGMSGGVYTDLESYSAVTESTAAVFAIDVANRPAKNASFTISSTTAKTVTLTNVPARCELFMELTISSSLAATVTWTLNSGSSCTWLTGAAPTLSSGKVYRVGLFTNDSGATWDAHSIGGW